METVESSGGSVRYPPRASAADPPCSNWFSSASPSERRYGGYRERCPSGARSILVCIAPPARGAHQRAMLVLHRRKASSRPDRGGILHHPALSRGAAAVRFRSQRPASGRVPTRLIFILALSPAPFTRTRRSICCQHCPPEDRTYWRNSITGIGLMMVPPGLQLGELTPSVWSRVAPVAVVPARRPLPDDGPEMAHVSAAAPPGGQLHYAAGRPARALHPFRRDGRGGRQAPVHSCRGRAGAERRVALG